MKQEHHIMAVPAWPETDEDLDRLVTEIIGRVADKWTMILIDVLHEEGDCRFGELTRHCEGISQKMLTQTLRAMERDGLVTREVFPVVPPKVVYSLTQLGLGLGAAFCGVWKWAAENRTKIEAARQDYAARDGGQAAPSRTGWSPSAPERRDGAS